MYRLNTEPGCIVILMRHAATALNDPKHPVVRGWKDQELAPEGCMQAQLTANKLRAYNPKCVYSSDFMRDTQTGQIVASILNIPLEADFDSRTWDVGVYSGMPESEANPPIIEIYKHPWMTPPGSTESFNDFSGRFIAFLERKLKYAAAVDTARPVVIVTHGRCVAIAQAHLQGLNAWECLMPMPAGFATITVNVDRTLQMDFITPTEPVIADV